MKHALLLAALSPAGLLATDAAASLVNPLDPSSIIGGEPVSSCEWPSTVFLENCTGTLIHPEIVVYAAHCEEAERVWFAESVEDGVPTPAEGYAVETEYCWTNPAWPQEDIGPSRAADYAFCKLAEPVLDVPIVPPLMGCETTVLTSNAPVTLVGFGGTDQETFGVKFKVDTVLHYIDDWGVAVIGGGGQSPCAGDSGGPAFIQLPDGTWRAFGIVSGPNVGNCGDAMWFPTIHSAIPDIERISGIDVTPCHYGGDGQWSPSPGCRDFPLEPQNGAGKVWADGCAGGPVSEWGSTCGPIFDQSEDLLAPSGAIVEPEDRARIDIPEGSRTVAAVIEAEAADAISGVSWVELIVNGELVPNSRRVGSPWTWDVDLPPGVLEIEARVADWAGNEAITDSIVIGVGVDPPPAPEQGDSSSGGDAGGSSSGGSSTGEPGSASTTSGTSAAPSSTGDTDDTASQDDEGTSAAGDGCGCRSDSGGGGSWLLLLGLFAVRRRRRRSPGPVLLCAGLLASCGGEGGAPGAEDGSTTDDSTSSTSVPGSTSSAPASSDATSSGGSSSGDVATGSSSSSGSTGLGCEQGTLDCICTPEFTCDEGLACSLNTCIECDAGAITCPCRADDDPEGRCDEGLFCFGGLCSAPQPCPFLENLVCDEPEGTDVCLEGTDIFDCCATEPGVCEELSAGGRCPDGSDPDDCGGGTGTGSTGGSSSTGGT